MEGSLLEVVGNIQCSQGLSLGALLASCIDAVARLEDQKPSEVLIRLERHLSFLLDINGRDGDGDFPSLECSRSGSSLLLSSNTGTISTGRLSLDEIHEMLSLSKTRVSNDSEWLLETCLKIFDDLTKIESRASDTPTNQIQYPQVDLVFILGILYSLELLGTQQVVISSPIPFNPLSFHQGTSLAVLHDLLVGLPITTTHCLEHDQPLDPLAVTLLRVLSQNHRLPKEAQATFKLKASGVGKYIESPAIVSLLVGRHEDSARNHDMEPNSHSLWLSDHVTQMDCNLDDITGETLAHAIEVLLKEGAGDAWITPIVMKKGRPAHTLHCLCLPEREDTLLEILFRQTTTLGIRIYRNIPRAKLCRSMGVAQTPYRDNLRDGKVNVKVSKFHTGEIISIKPEFDHCQQISKESGIPLKFVTEEALYDMRKQLQQKQLEF